MHVTVMVSPYYSSMSGENELLPFRRHYLDTHILFSSISFDDFDGFAHRCLLSGSYTLHETWILIKLREDLIFFALQQENFKCYFGKPASLMLRQRFGFFSLNSCMFITSPIALNYTS